MKKHINRLGVRTASAVAAMVFVANAAWALEPFKVQDIRVEGLQRVEPGTVFASMPLRVGDDYNDEKGAAAIRALFGLGLFKDVRLEASGNVLVVVVEERPTVADVDFAGAREFDKDALKKAMREVGLAEGRPYDKALTDLNTIRNRSIVNGGYPAGKLNADNAFELIDKERQLELAYQAERSYDVFRNGHSLTRDYPGPHNQHEEVKASDYRVTYYIPQNAINAYPGTLTQNPTDNSGVILK